MGNQQHNGVVIQLQCDAVFTGEMLRGIKNKRQGKIECWGEELSKIVLHIKGYEKTSLSRKQGGCLSRNRNDGVYTFYQHEFVIHEFETYERNQREIFPFQFIVDSSLPGSLNLKQKPIRGKISYSLKAVLHSRKGITATKCPFQIMEQPSTMLGRKQYVFNAQIEKFYSMKHGNTRIECCINQHQFLVGDDVVLELLIDNSECDIDINSFSINLIKFGNIYNQKDDVISYDEILQTIKIEGINAGLKYSIPKIQQIKLIDPENRIKPSVNGSLVDQNYCIGIKVNVSAFNAFNSKPQLLIPIQIYARLSQKLISQIHTLGENNHPISSLVVQRKPEKQSLFQESN